MKAIKNFLQLYFSDIRYALYTIIFSCQIASIVFLILMFIDLFSK